MRTQLDSLARLLVVPAVWAAGCTLDLEDFNNPGLDELENDPTRELVVNAATGLVFGHRANVAIDNGYVSLLGVLGREAYLFSEADPGFVTELLQQQPGLDPGSAASGGAFWLRRYLNIHDGFRILAALDRLPDDGQTGFSTAEKSAIRGFVKTLQALDYLVLIITRDDNGVPFDVNTGDVNALAPILCKDITYTRIASLLDEAATDLSNAGAIDMPFPLGLGFTDFVDGLGATQFNTVVGFRQLNRGIKARVEIYRGEYASALNALGESFVRPTAPTDTLSADDLSSLGIPGDPTKKGAGVYHVYSTLPGDTTNEISQLQPTLFVHPSVPGDALCQTGQVSCPCAAVTACTDAELELKDLRVASKVRALTATESPGQQTYTDGSNTIQATISSSMRFTVYRGITSAVPILRNVELVLLRAEANWGQGNLADAIRDINAIRTTLGNLDPLVVSATADQVRDAIIYERRYSLMFEGGFRWIDARRFVDGTGTRVVQLPLDVQGLDDPGNPDFAGSNHTVYFALPIQADEFNAREGNIACVN